MATTADYLTQLQADKQALVDILVSNNVEASADETFTTLVPKTANMSGGGSKDEWDTSVDFIDFNGDLLYHYTQEEIQAMEELPSPPEHELLEFTNWNWSLEELKEWGKGMVVGAIYNTVDGSTKIRITIDKPMTVQLYGLVIKNGRIDWGDGTVEEVNQTTWSFYNYHEYTNTGKYVISMYGDDVQIANTSNSVRAVVPEGIVDEVYVGEGHYIFEMGSTKCYWHNLTAFSFPENCRFSTQYGFQPQGMHKIKAIIAPRSINCRVGSSSRRCEYISVPKYSQGIYISEGNAIKRLTPAYLREGKTGYIYLYSAYSLKELDLAGYSGVPNNDINNAYSLTKLRNEGVGCTPKIYVAPIEEITFTGPHSSSNYNTVYNTNIKKAIIPNTYTVAPVLQNNYLLEEIVLSEGITELPGNFASNCYNLRKIKGFEQIKKVGSSVFYNDPFLDIDISNVETLSSSCFGNMRSLKKAIFNNSITDIPASTCYGCEAMEEIRLPENLKTIGSSAFTNTKCENIYIPVTVTSIDNSAFQASTLRSVQFGSDENLITLGDYNFGYVENIKFPNSIQTIGNYYHGYNAEYINIPRDCVSIGSYFCQYASKLKEIDATLCTQVPTIGSNLFKSASKDFIIKVPQELYNEWISATNWSAFADNIQGV